MSAATERASMLRCVSCGAVLLYKRCQVVEGDLRCGCGSLRLRPLRADELRAWAAIEGEGALSAEGRLRAVMVRCGMEE